jgi:hypothetical protein
MQRFASLILLMVCGGLLSSCFLFGSDDDQPRPEPVPPIDQLPPLTTEGKGTFGCLVNGEAFVSYYPDALADYTIVDNISISGSSRDPQSAISLSISNYLGEKGFQPFNKLSIFYNNWDIYYPLCDYASHELIAGSIEIIEYNPFDRFIAGKFNFTSVNEECDTLYVSDGRFDLPVIR